MSYTAFLQAIPAAASSPLALIAYLAALASFTAIGLRVKRNNNLLKNLVKIPEADRKSVVINEMGRVIPDNITADQWILLQTRKLYFYVFVIILACVSAVSIWAFIHSDDFDNIQISYGGPVFENPRINGRTIDACIISSQFPSRAQLECTHAATNVIASAFCKAAGYNSASNFKTAFSSEMQESYKFFRDVDSNGYVVQRWFEDNTGGSEISEIACV